MKSLIFINNKYNVYVYSTYILLFLNSYNHYRKNNILNYRSNFIKDLKTKNIFAIIYACSNSYISLIGYFQTINHHALSKELNKNINWKADGYFFIFGGFISFLSDVVFFGMKNISKLLDYYFARSMIFHNLIKVIIAYQKNNDKNKIILISFFLGFIPYYFSNYYYINGNLNKYFLFHSIWHIYPLIVYIIYLKVNLDSKIKLLP